MRHTIGKRIQRRLKSNKKREVNQAIQALRVAAFSYKKKDLDSADSAILSALGVDPILCGKMIPGKLGYGSSPLFNYFKREERPFGFFE